MVKVGLLLNDSGFENKKLDNPWEGNPGIGGTQYCFIMLATALAEMSNYEVICFHFDKSNHLISLVESVIVKDDIDAIKKAKKLNVDVFLMKSPTDEDVFNEIDYQKLPTISWAHNYILGKSLQLHKRSKYIKRVVFVGKQEYDRYIDDDIINKSDYIFNMFKSNNEHQRKETVSNIVTYTGSLVKQKGFHILAEVWKDILKKVPDAQLYVIGSGSLYNSNEKLGSYGIAAESYEKMFMPFLVDENGQIMSSVHFMGKMGAEKSKVYEMTKVGVMNPSARTETFGLSAVEMNEFGIPVCTEGKNGLPDTVVNGHTGLLSHGKRALENNIVKLLKDTKYNLWLGNQGKEFIKKFEPGVIAQEWIKEIEDVYLDKKVSYKKPEDYYGNNAKWLRIVNRFLRNELQLTFLKSVVEIEIMVRSFLIRRR